LKSIEASSEDEEQDDDGEEGEEQQSALADDSPRSDSEKSRPPPPTKSREMEILEEAMAAAESSLAGVQADLQSAQVIRVCRPSGHDHVTHGYRISAKRFSCSWTSRRALQVKLRRG
jgi:hypothetical protein